MLRLMRDGAHSRRASGRLFGICVEKSSELNAGDPRRKFKGRVVFQGNRARDQKVDVSIFQDLGGYPANVESARVADWHGCLPGHPIDAADADQACMQADLKDTST